MRKARAGKGGYAITILVGVIAVLYFFPVLIAIVNSFKTKGSHEQNSKRVVIAMVPGHG